MSNEMKKNWFVRGLERGRRNKWSFALGIGAVLGICALYAHSQPCEVGDEGVCFNLSFSFEIDLGVPPDAAGAV